MANKAMTKTQIVSHIAERANITKKESAGILEELADLAVKETKRSGQFVIPGIGKLVKSNRKARKGRNPQTGEELQIPAKTVVKFRVSKVCKDAVIPPKR
ncbi:MAG TPA: HU family DNA-binding protein [Vicinamibacteria bacterium]|nr:HU family DNA-binding protein [Vicinamibacteria bacterium]